jgi:hypothetical protein
MKAKPLVRIVAPFLVVAAIAVAILWYRGGPIPRGGTPQDSTANESVLTGEISRILPAGQVAHMQQKALRGDDVAAETLGGHYSDLGDGAAERRWRSLAANRGYCPAIDHLRELEAAAHNRAAATHWNDELRRRRCVVAQTYTPPAEPALNQTQAWIDNYQG